MLAPEAPALARRQFWFFLPSVDGAGMVELVAVDLSHEFLCPPSCPSESTSLPGDHATIFRKAGLSNEVK